MDKRPVNAEQDSITLRVPADFVAKFLVTADTPGLVTKTTGVVEEVQKHKPEILEALQNTSSK